MVPAPQPSSSQPFPAHLKSHHPNPQTPWNFSEALFKRVQNYTSDKSFKLCEVLNTDPEINFILKYFEHQKPPGYSIKRVVCIHNPDHTQMFESTLKNMEREASNPVFAPKGKDEEPKADRTRVLARWEAQASQFFPIEIKSMTSRGTDACLGAKALPLWHGSTKEVCQSICWSGFTSFGKHHYFDENALKGNTKSTDKGYFGAGIYFTNSAQYATMYSSAGHLLLSWVSMREPYPVVNDKPHPQKGNDMVKLEGRMHYQNYNAHFIPVASIRPSDPKCIEYYPCYKDQQPDWDEFVVFHTSQALPRFWIELGVDFPKVALSDLGTSGELLTLLLSLLDKSDIQQHAALAQMLQIKADLMLEQIETTPLGAEDQRFLKLAKRILPEGEKLNSATASMLLKMGTTASPTPPMAAPVKAFPIPISVASLVPVLPKASVKHILPAIAFGKGQWAKYLGDIGEEPPLPPDIQQILQNPCPFWPGKKVEETHLLMLIPRSVNGRPLTLNYLLQLIQHPKQGPSLQYLSCPSVIKDQHGKTPVPNSYWTLFTNDVIPNSHNKSFDAQFQLLKDFCQKANVSYVVPGLLEVVTILCLEYLRAGKIQIYQAFRAENALCLPTTHCEEKINSYDFSDHISVTNLYGTGLVINVNLKMDLSLGMGASRRLIEEMQFSSASSHSSAGENTSIVNSSSLFTTPLMNSVLSKPQALPEASLSKPLPPIPIKRALPNIALGNPIKDLSTGRPSLPAIAFGKVLWEKYIGDVGIEPPLPSNIHEILRSPCPFFPGKNVQETHLLMLIPQIVNGKSLTLNYLEGLVKRPKQGSATQLRDYSDNIKKEYGDKNIQSSYWVLLTKDIIPESREKSYQEQLKLLDQYCQKARVKYEAPQLLEMAISLFLNYVEKGNRRFSDEPGTFTCCQETIASIFGLNVLVGCFAQNGLTITYGEKRGSIGIGMGASRKLLA